MAVGSEASRRERAASQPARDMPRHCRDRQHYEPGRDEHGRQAEHRQQMRTTGGPKLGHIAVSWRTTWSSPAFMCGTARRNSRLPVRRSFRFRTPQQDHHRPSQGIWNTSGRRCSAARHRISGHQQAPQSIAPAAQPKRHQPHPRRAIETITPPFRHQARGYRENGVYTRNVPPGRPGDRQRQARRSRRLGEKASQIARRARWRRRVEVITAFSPNGATRTVRSPHRCGHGNRDGAAKPTRVADRRQTGAERHGPALAKMRTGSKRFSSCRATLSSR